MDANKLEESLSSRNLSGVRQALMEYQESNAGDRETRLLLDDTILGRLDGIAEDLRFQGEEIRGEGVITHDHEEVRTGEQLLAESLEWEVALAELAALNRRDSSGNDRLRLPPTFEMAEIPAGAFIMGSPGSEVGHKENESQVEVQISKSFQLSRTVVTQQQWMGVMGTAPWNRQTLVVVDEGEIVHVSLEADVATGDEFPAVFMSWHHARAFCRVLTFLERRQGRLSETQEYRLPTEAEWEYACRAGATSAYCFGDEVEMLVEYAWCAGDYDAGYAKVGQKKLNRWGLHDMHGNVWEWCADWYVGDLPGGLDPLVTGVPFSQVEKFGEYPLSEPRVVRGGDWSDEPASCRSATRDLWDPWVRDHFSNNVGFRIVLGSCIAAQ